MKNALLTLLTIVALALPALADRQCNASSRFGDFAMLTEGLGGSIAPKPITYQAIVRADGRVYTKRLEKNGSYSYHQGRVKDAPAFLKAVYAQVHDLPVEDPEGMDDIYRIETGIHVNVDGACWFNQPVVGCVRGQSKVLPTPEQKTAFQEEVTRMQKFTAPAANQACSQADFEAVLIEMFSK